jgi:hypothetical protein
MLQVKYAEVIDRLHLSPNKINKKLRHLCREKDMSMHSDSQQFELSLEAQKLVDPGFVFMIDIDPETNVILAVLWMTGREVERAHKLGKIVIFDTTHKSNIHDMYLGLFVTVNEFGKTETLGKGFCLYQDTDSFEWMFRTFQELTGVCPSVLMTDGDLAIAAAIKIG